MNDEDFQKQLELEELEKQKKEQGINSHIYKDPNDGTIYEWNAEKQAWFPKIDDDFLMAYHSNYTYEETKSTEVKPDVEGDSSQTSKGEKRKANNEPGWFEVDDAHNTNVYVSNLPLDMTEDEFIEMMNKCGLVMKDPDNGQFKIKLYRNPDGTLKGDGRCCYIKVESVDLALSILDGYRLKDKIIHVEKAKFSLKGAYDPSKKPRKKKGKEKEKLKKKMEKLFDWRPEKLRGMRSKHENVVIIKNMFDPIEFEQDPGLLLEYKKDLREECSKCGAVKKVVIYDRHSEGVVSVSFKEIEEADQCVVLMNGRWFAGRQLKAETWDGHTKYKIEETAEEKEKRLQQWDKFLDKDDDETPNTNTDSKILMKSLETDNANKNITNVSVVCTDSEEKISTLNQEINGQPTK